jgi:hypothetical protein
MVKIADIEDNMLDLEEGSMKDKYRFAHHMLRIMLELAFDKEKINTSFLSNRRKKISLVE